MADVDQVLGACEEVQSLSFYGLVHWLSELGTLIERADRAALAKAPRAEEAALLERKEELLEAQARLRRTIGANLESPSLTKREKPLAEAFLGEQILKLQGQASRDERAAKGMERLKQILAGVKSAPVVADSKAVRDIDTSSKQAEGEWKELSPLYEKWEAGRHSFKSNADLQAFKRRYEDCRKVRESAAEKLEAALRVARPAGSSRSAEVEGLAPGWSGVAKKAAAPAPVRNNANARGAAAVALDAAKRKSASAKSNSWAASAVSFAQRLRAEAVAKVRNETQDGGAPEPDDDEEDEAEDNDEDFWEVGSTNPKAPPPPPKARPPPPAVPTNKQAPQADGGNFVAPKVGRSAKSAPAPASADLSSLANSGQRWGAAAAHESDSEQEYSAATAGPAASGAGATKKQATSFNASAKKKSKAKKKNGAQEQEDDDNIGVNTMHAVPPNKGSLPSWFSAVELAVSGSVLADLLRPSAWAIPAPEEAEGRLEQFRERLPFSSPLGLVLPLTWAEFAGLEVDGGPKRTSKRGESPWMQRVSKNVPELLGHYLTMLFFLMLLHSLSHFGLFILPALAQAALLLMPPGQLAQVSSSAHVLLLQGAHLLLWLGFGRSLLLMHLFIKIFTVLIVAGHAYVVAGIQRDD
eukprot:TRINITY_DN21_c0_g1_i1.p1 TRINITY_DN21_c0_g1~~TRINITY_DN21_c0_g1_i1.p1  ORF type:complete len:639 (+),score=155.31 TRINITY_DN21_c0_g1_i1:40-1956(+)